MVGKRTLVKGIIFGAIAGGLTALLDKDARDYARLKVSTARSKSFYYIKNPSEAVRNIRVSVDRWNDTMTSSVKNTVNALEQVEETLDKVTSKTSNPKRLE